MKHTEYRNKLNALTAQQNLETFRMVEVHEAQRKVAVAAEKSDRQSLAKKHRDEKAALFSKLDKEDPFGTNPTTAATSATTELDAVGTPAIPATTELPIGQKPMEGSTAGKAEARESYRGVEGVEGRVEVTINRCDTSSKADLDKIAAILGKNEKQIGEALNGRKPLDKPNG